MSIRKLFSLGISVIFAAVVLRILLPIPVITTLTVLATFLVVQIIEARFGTGIRIATSWVKIGIKTVVAFVAFIALRFLTGQVLGIYPVAARNEWGSDNGAVGIFWGNHPYPVIAHELVIVMIIGWILWGCTRGQRMAKFAAFVLAVIIFIGVLFPMWAGSWPKSREAIDKSLATKGVAGTIPPLGIGGGNPITNTVCDEAWDNPIVNGYGSSDQPTFAIRIPDGCWGAVVVLPGSWTSGWCYQPVPRNDPGPDWRIAFQFIGADGVASKALGLFHPMDTPYFAYHPMSFRIQGHGVVRFFRGACAP